MTFSKVRHRCTSAIFALKVLCHHDSLAARGADILGRVDSPFLVRCHAVFSSDDGDMGWRRHSQLWLVKGLQYPWLVKATFGVTPPSSSTAGTHGCLHMGKNLQKHPFRLPPARSSIRATGASVFDRPAAPFLFSQKNLQQLATRCRCSFPSPNSLPWLPMQAYLCSAMGPPCSWTRNEPGQSSFEHPMFDGPTIPFLFLSTKSSPWFPPVKTTSKALHSCPRAWA